MKVVEIHTAAEIAAEVKRLIEQGIVRVWCLEEDLRTEAYNRLTLASASWREELLMRMYLDGEDRLVLWPADKRQGWEKLDPIELSDEELAEIKRVSNEFWTMQEKLAERFGFSRFYV